MTEKQDGVLRLCGYTEEGRPVMGGAFQMADTMGFPLAFALAAAEAAGAVVSIPHYFASAMEHGWDDRQTFARIAEALRDQLGAAAPAMDGIKMGCIALFMNVAKANPGANAMELGRIMRTGLEAQVV